MRRIMRRQAIVPILATTAFFVAFLLLGIAIYHDYGTYIDEHAQVNIGWANYNFLKTGDASQLNIKDWEYGPVFELFITFTQRFLHPEWHDEDYYYLRHLDVFLVFWLSTIAFCWLVTKKFRSWKIGLLGCLFLILTPVIFGNAFYNSKDIPFLSFFIFSLLTLNFFLERPNILTACAHALVCSLLIDIRVLGILIPALTVGLLALELASKNRRELHPKLGQTLLSLEVFLVATVGLTVFFFPAIWSNPIQKFLEVYQTMTHYSWTFACNLLMGSCYHWNEIPWFYVPVWMGVTTPPFYLGLFLIGIAVGVGKFFARPRLQMSAEKRSSLIYLVALFLPLAVVVIAHSVIYNSWRHLYFVYAPFLMIALEGLVGLYRFLKKRFKIRLAAGIVGVFTLVSVSTTAAYMIQNHPNQFVYFNFLAGPDMQQIKQNYELDYWGLSYVAGLRYILAHDSRDSIVVVSNQKQIPEFVYILSNEDQKRFVFATDINNADYYITNYYMHPQNYDLSNEVFSVKVGDASLVSVFKLR